MSDLGLTQLEKNLVAALAHESDSKSSRLGFYAAVLIPALAFAGYGIYKKDLVALGLAFFGLLLFLWWRISQELQHFEPYAGVFKKVAAHERAQQGIQADAASPRRLT